MSPNPPTATTAITAAVVTRRAAVLGACGICVAAVSACSSYGSGGAAPTGTGGASTPSGGGAAPAVQALASTADIPVGGGVIFAEQDIVVTQPVAGEFKAFSATCTHMGCSVAEVVDGTINCPCHGSRFAVADGAPTAGPASRPLPEKAVAVQGGSVVLA
jgi:nitrite reductase/ring-hydroxylating ferredoxin subunit